MNLNSWPSCLHFLRAEITSMYFWAWLAFLIIYNFWSVACYNHIRNGLSISMQPNLQFLWLAHKVLLCSPVNRRNGPGNVLECTQVHKIRKGRNIPPLRSSGCPCRFAWTLYTTLASSDLCCFPTEFCCKAPLSHFFLISPVICLHCSECYQNALIALQWRNPPPWGFY